MRKVHQIVVMKMSVEANNCGIGGKLAKTMREITSVGAM